MNDKVIEVLIRKFGEQVSYCHDGGAAQSFRAFLQPVNYKNRQYLSDIHTPVGRVDTGRWMYYGPGSVALADDGLGVLRSGGRSFRVCRSEALRFDGAVCYVRAVLEPEREAAV